MSLAGLHVFAPGYDPAHDPWAMPPLEQEEYFADLVLWKLLHDTDPMFLRELGIHHRGFDGRPLPATAPGWEA